VQSWDEMLMEDRKSCWTYA